jgi:hypothetical protein
VQASPSRNRIISLAALAWLIPALFFLKAALLGLRIVPLWDIPDELGHFAYARDLGSGRGLLPLGVAEIGADIMSDAYEQPTEAITNWIVQHPPLYHLLAGAVWKAGTLFTDDSALLFRLPRLVSAFFGALTLFFVFKIIARLGLGAYAALAVAAAFASVPTFAWMSAGTNHDTMIAALSAAAAWQFTEFMLGRQPQHAYASLLLLALAALTKITALVLIPPLIVILVLEMPWGRG